MTSRLRLLPAFLFLAFAPGMAAAQSNDGFYASVSGFYVLPTEPSASYAEGDLDGTKADYGSHNLEIGLLFRF